MVRGRAPAVGVRHIRVEVPGLDLIGLGTFLNPLSRSLLYCKAEPLRRVHEVLVSHAEPDPVVLST